MPTLSIIIPVYNEVNTLRSVLDLVNSVKLPRNIKKEIVIVDDCSSDGTRDVLKTIKGRQFKIFFHEENTGKGGALHTGIKNATGDYVIIQDADMEYDPHEYVDLLQPMLSRKADVVYGSRFIGKGPHRILYYWHSLGNWFLTTLSNMFSDLNLTDMETCYKLFRKEVLDRMELREKRFGFEPEITAKIGELVRAGEISLYEVGISYHGRTYAEGKKIGWKDGMRALWCIFKYNTSWFARGVKYGLGGALIALSQLLSMVFLVEGLAMSGLLEQNIANLISIAIAVSTGYVIHSNFTWARDAGNSRSRYGGFLLFHLITFLSIPIRAGMFYFLSTLGVHYITNSLLGIFAAVIINFLGYDRLVFKSARKAS